MFYTIDTLINCVCCGFVAAAVPLIIHEVLMDLREKREEREDRYFSDGRWHHK